jgi:hypothetical protein
MPNIVVDVESDGPCPGLYSMVCFGAVLVEDTSKTFYGQTRPISDEWQLEALAISGFSRETHETFDEPSNIMVAFDGWLGSLGGGRPVLWSDNPAYDWQFINYYFHRYIGHNPFGFSARRIGDYYCGMKGSTRAGWKHLRTTVHDHNPVNDAKGNAEAMIKMGIRG